MESKPEKDELHRKYGRRTLGIVVCFSPAVVLIWSILLAQFWPRQSSWGLGLMIAALFLASLNLYVAIVRPWLHVWRHASLEGLRRISGVPLLGTLLTLAGGLVGFGDWHVATVGIVALALDIGGLPWFLVATWHDASLWDA